MEEGFQKGDACPQLLDLIPKGRDWMGKDGGGGDAFGVAEERRLELRLGPPGDQEAWSAVNEKREDPSVLSLGYISGAKRGFLGMVEPKQEGLGKESSRRATGKAEEHQRFERKAGGPPPSPAHAAVAPTPGNAVGANNMSQTRTASVPIVGWPPIRSFRKNLGTTSSKPTSESHKGAPETAEKPSGKGLLVKIHMDGIPIGRKVDLKAYDSYEKLSLAVDELFRGLLAAQRDPIGPGNRTEENLAITGLLDGTGEYTLVYEDNEGDRMLVGDVPWNMFVSTAKRLRVLKSSELTTLSSGSASKKRTAAEC